jgi:hypothetical protein
MVGGCGDSSSPARDAAPDASDAGGGDSPLADASVDTQGQAGQGGPVADGGDAPAQEVAPPDAAEDGGVDTQVDEPLPRPDASSTLGAPTDLAAAVLDRRQTSFRLTWKAPAVAGGATVTGYEVRYAKAKITEATFDDDAVSTRVAFAGAPAAAGQAESLTVPGLYVETEYFFAVAAVDADSHRGPLVASSVAVSAAFNVAMLPGLAANDAFGFTMDGQGDLNGDKLSDLLVGTFGASKAYLYLGTAQTFAPTAPSVTFTGTTPNFGNNVSQIGDLDADGLQDVAVSDSTNAKVYIYKGRATWPATLTDAQADYVIGGDATYTGSQLGSALARLGDFTGDGVDDVAIGARNYSTFVGRVVIIAGKAGFTSVTLPDATRAITIDGDNSVDRPAFGSSVVGLGHFYNATAGTTLIVGSPGTASSVTASAGRVYAFHGQTGTAGAIPLASADHSIVGPALDAHIGIFVSNLGPVIGSLPNVGIGNPLDNVDFAPILGAAYVTSGTTATGPLANRLIVGQTGSYFVGSLILGGGLSGRDGALSLVGDAKPDVVLAAQMSGFITIADGARLPGATGVNDFAKTAQVKVSLPPGWDISNGGGSLLPDVNGDGRPDFAVRKATAPLMVAVYY